MEKAGTQPLKSLQDWICNPTFYVLAVTHVCDVTICDASKK